MSKQQGELSPIQREREGKMLTQKYLCLWLFAREKCPSLHSKYSLFTPPAQA